VAKPMLSLITPADSAETFASSETNHSNGDPANAFDAGE
jgi:hypothetical protein